VLHANDDVFVDAPPAEVYRRLLHVHEDSSWWPGARARGGFAWLELIAPAGPSKKFVHFKVRIEESRPDEGFKWVFEDGPLQGWGEFWFEPFRAGTIVHYVASVQEKSRANSDLKLHRWAIREGLNAMKDALQTILR
jgi:hypothetical protein